MSTIRKYQIEIANEIQVTIVSQDELLQLLEQLWKRTKEKLLRITSNFKSCSFAYASGNVFLSDALGIEPDLETVLQGYGYLVHHPLVDEKTKSTPGRLIQITDQTLDLLAILTQDETVMRREFEAILEIDKTLSGMMNEAIKNRRIPTVSSGIDDQLLSHPEVAQLISDVIHGRDSTIAEHKIIEREVRDGQQVYEIELKKSSNLDLYQKAKDIIYDMVEQVNEHHQRHMVAGTTISLEFKAKKMGYTVKKVHRGNEVELILMRGE